MPANITDVATFTDPVQIPADTESANSASLLLFAQALANRTRQLKGRIDRQTTVITPAQITSNQDNYAPTGGADAWHWRISSDAVRVIKGMVPGDFRFITNINTDPDHYISFEYDATGQTAGYQIAPGPDSTLFDAIGVGPGITKLFMYDDTSDKWRVVEQSISAPDWTFAGELHFTNAVGLRAKGGPVRALTNFEYCDADGDAAPQSRTLMLPLSHGCHNQNTNWSTLIAAPGTWARGTSAPTSPSVDFICWELDIPSNATLTQVRAGVEQGATATNDMKLEVYRITYDKNADFTPTVALLGSDTAADDGHDVLAVSALAENMNRAQGGIVIKILPSDSGTSADLVYWVEVTFDDAGPYNA